MTSIVLQRSVFSAIWSAFSVSSVLLYQLMVGVLKWNFAHQFILCSNIELQSSRKLHQVFCLLLSDELYSCDCEIILTVYCIIHHMLPACHTHDLRHCVCMIYQQTITLLTTLELVLWLSTQSSCLYFLFCKPKVVGSILSSATLRIVCILNSPSTLWLPWIISLFPLYSSFLVYN